VAAFNFRQYKNKTERLLSISDNIETRENFSNQSRIAAFDFGQHESKEDVLKTTPMFHFELPFERCGEVYPR